MFLWWGVVSTSPNPQAGGSPLVSCPWLLIQYIHGCPPYWRPFLHTQPEDVPCHGDRDPLITSTYSLLFIIYLLWWLVNWKRSGRKCLWPNLRYYLGICVEGLKTAEFYWDVWWLFLGFRPGTDWMLVWNFSATQSHSCAETLFSMIPLRGLYWI